MEMFIVKPNLELLSCQDQSHQALVNQKSAYLQHLSKIQSLCHSHQKELPSWCHDSSRDVDCTSLALGRRTSVVSNDSQPDTVRGLASLSLCDNAQDKNCLGIQLQSLRLTNELIESEEPFPFSVLGIPSDVSSKDRTWVDLKKLQLETDIALVKYKYNKALTKLNSAVKCQFSKAFITPEEEERGLKVVSKDCDKFKRLERVLSKLVDLNADFSKKNCLASK